MLRKSHQQCDHITEIALIVTFTLVSILLLGMIGALIYYYRRRPLQRLQRARSRVYSRLYSRDKYFRPILKSDFVDKVSSHLLQMQSEIKVRFLKGFRAKLFIYARTRSATTRIELYLVRES